MTPCGPNDAPHSRQCISPSPHAVFLILSRRLERRLRAHANYYQHRDTNLAQVCHQKVVHLSEHLCMVGDVIQCNRDNGFPSHSILSCSMASIIAARASTLLMISFSSSVSSSPGVPPGMFIVHLILLNPKHTHTNTQNRHRVQVTSKVKIRLRQMAKTSKKCLRSARH